MQTNRAESEGGPGALDLLVEIALLVALLAAPLVHPGIGALLLLAAVVLWRRGGRTRGERAIALVAGVVSLALVALAPALRPAPGGESQASETLSAGYGVAWAEIDSLARQVAAASSPSTLGPEGRQSTFRQLEAAIAATGSRRLGLLVVDPDGEAWAWAGRGFLHQPRADEIPRAGPLALASWGAVTVASVFPVSTEESPWRVIAGRSELTDSFPFLRDTERRGFGRWSLAGAGETPGDGLVMTTTEGAPVLVVEGSSESDPSSRLPLRRGVWMVLGLGLLAAAVTRVAALHRGRPIRSAPVLLVFGGLSAAALAAGVDRLAVAALLGGALIAAIGLRFGGRQASARWSLGLGAVALVGASALVVSYQRQTTMGDLVAEPWYDPLGMVLRTALALGVAGLLALVGGWSTGETPSASRDRYSGLAGLLLIGSASTADHTGIALALLGLAGGVTAVWLGSAAARAKVGGSIVFALLITAATATCWEVGQRLVTRERVVEEILPQMLGPARDTIRGYTRRVNRYFDDLDLATLTPGRPQELRADDLAFVAWRDSPLATASIPSAVAIDREGEETLQFSFGLPLTREGELDLEPARWQALDLEPWQDRVRGGVAHLLTGGRLVGRVRYWFLPLPGADLEEAPGSTPTPALHLLDRPLASGRGESVLRPGMRLARLDPNGVVVVAAWPEQPVDELLATNEYRRRVETPDGPAWAFSATSPEGTTVLFLPLTGLRGLERVGSHVFAILVPLLVVALVALFVALPRARVRARLRTGLQSYSKQLLLVYGLLLGVPLLLVNAAFLRTFERRLVREQMTRGEAAVASAQQVLGERLFALEPGFVLDTALDDSVLIGLSRVIHHEINLYWGSNISASSKRQLFEAGMLPQRIPGEIFSRLGLAGAVLGARTNRAGSKPFLELYAPLQVPGVTSDPPRLFVSVPLFTQEEETEAEVANLRRRALLVSAILVIVAVVAGNRLSDRFGRPLQDLVEGTRRIAAGAGSLDLSPTETELQELVLAVDDMAQRIDEGRRRLMREKQLVERIVEHVTAGIVSVDSRGRVMMANRVASEMLGTEVGAELAGSLEASGHLEPVVRFLRGVDTGPRATTVRLSGPGGDEVELHLVWVPVPGQSDPTALFVVEDATEVLRSERLQAWAEMARIIAHEVKNPLTPIRLSTDHMLEVYRRDRESFDEVFPRCAENILRQVDELQEIVQEFSTYSAVLRPEIEPGDLNATLQSLSMTYEASISRGVRLVVESSNEQLAARFDERLLLRALRNLVENALRAMGEKGTVSIALVEEGDRACFTVSDEGPGVPEEDLSRIFDPYFSTHDAGTGLGLPIARRIAEAHGGGTQARNRKEGGLEVTITIPL